MIGLGLTTDDTSAIYIGNTAISEVYVGSTKVWPTKIDNPPGLDANGHQWVDMGEAGIWASCNVKATSPEEFGYYFQWADPRGCPRETGGTSSGLMFGDTHYKYYTDNGFPAYAVTTISKYNTMHYMCPSGVEEPDYEITVALEDDGANAYMGGDWRTPTKSEWEKLLNLCNKEFTSINNVNGVRLTLKSDSSKSIFIPAAGYFTGIGGLSGSNNAFAYMTGTLGWMDELSGETYAPLDCYAVHGTSSLSTFGDIRTLGYKRSGGYPIRAILTTPSEEAIPEDKFIKLTVSNPVMYGNVYFVNASNLRTQISKSFSTKGLNGDVIYLQAEGKDPYVFSNWTWGDNTSTDNPVRFKLKDSEAPYPIINANFKNKNFS